MAEQLSASGRVVITHEDIDRAHDRERVRTTRTQRGVWSRARLLWLLIGPGILVMLGENDGPACCRTPLQGRTSALASSFLS